ncbi:PadR family transcriptional regulator [Actinoplanes capillaceus]|uniref:PadR family transcriptional regulator n=1 Tax=Actinoplanes campanulatus TaxID=113559 RepID=A0ABQ3WJV3_9ACTN|nr:PadR family transcriptional regulator [Actinoplanes capillaceus]GID46502.1 PadR family transcriptional regulator [Actinoplanes capillaceus]
MRKADRDLASLTVLALLMTGPRHAYEMNLLIEKTHKTFVTGLPRSLYHAVNRLVGAGEIRVSDVVREAGRPERTVYALTDQGRARLRDWIGVLLREPDPDSSLLTAALSFAGCLPPETVAGLLRERRAGLEHRLAAARAVPELPRILLIETEYEVSRLTAERDWVSGIAADIETGRLTWPADLAETADVTPLLEENG